MSKMPFNPLLLPYPDKIDNLYFLDELVCASEKLSAFNYKINNTKTDKSMLMTHLFNSESFYSTRIEGTQTTIDEVYEAKETKKENNEVTEVLRYIAALEFAGKDIQINPISSRMIKEIHRILLGGANARKNTGIQAGEYRTLQNKVGEHIPPEPNKVDYYMSNLENYINNMEKYQDNLQALVKAAIIHAQFETIHPFPDGNGRVGRVLIPLYLCKEKKIDDINFFISSALEKNKYRYYEFLQETRTNSIIGFSNWIKFFLESIYSQCLRHIDFLDEIQNLYDNIYKNIISKTQSNNNIIILNKIFEKVIFSAKSISEETKIPINTVRNYLNIFAEKKIITKDDKKRNKMYYFYSLLQIIRNQ